MVAVAGSDKEMWQTGVGVFPPGSPLANDAGMEVLNGKRDLEKVKRELKAAGYKDEKVVILGVTDLANLKAEGDVGSDMLMKCGMNVDSQTMDWGTVVERRAKTEPRRQGGWNIFLTGWAGLDSSTRSVICRCGQRARCWARLADDAQARGVASGLVRGGERGDPKEARDQIQIQVFIDVPYIPLGQYYLPVAFKKYVTGTLTGFPIFWNVREGSVGRPSWPSSDLVRGSARPSMPSHHLYRKTWMPGTRLHKAGHDVQGVLMRSLIAQFSHEMNTFSPVPTPIARFCREGDTPLFGKAAIAHYSGTGTCMGGFLDVAASVGAEIVVPIAASAPPSGPVERSTYEACAKAITDAVAKGGFDGLMLDLHGAMVAEHVEDGEGELLRRIRAIDAKVPIAVALDMHANIYEHIVKLSTVIAGYHLYPHTDMAETARRAGALLVKAIRGEARPVMAWGNVPMLPHVMAQGTHQAPNKTLQEKAARWEKEGTALSAALFVGFSHADIREAGLSAVVTTDGDGVAAQRLVDELLHDAWAARHDFVFKVEPLAQSVARAKAMPAEKSPIFLLDHYDNCALGRHDGTTAVLAEILREELEDVAYGIYDPKAVQEAIAAGVGARLKLSIGGKIALPALDRPNPRLTVEEHGEDDLDRLLHEPLGLEPRRRRYWPDRRPQGHGKGRDRAPLQARGADRDRHAERARHRPARQALRRHQKPRPLAGGPRQARGRHRRMRGARRMHLRITTM